MTLSRGADAPGSARAPFTLDDEGWIEGVLRIDSPNSDERPAGEAVSLLVVHAISLPPGRFGGEDVIRLFTNTLDANAHPYFRGIAQLRVSAHFLIRRDGKIVQFVSCHRRAWHAGLSQWDGRERCNDFSLGVELEGDDDTPFTDRQYGALNRLASALCRRFPIRAAVGHSDIAPGRKTDPGPFFDWSRVRMPCKHADPKPSS